MARGNTTFTARRNRGFMKIDCKYIRSHQRCPVLMFQGRSLIAHKQGGKGGAFPRRRITARDAEKSQQRHKYFLQYSTFASKKPQVRKWRRQTCFLPQAPSNLVTPLLTSYFPKFIGLMFLVTCYSCTRQSTASALPKPSLCRWYT